MHSVARPIQIPSTQLDSPAVSGHMVPPAAASASGSEADEPPRMAKFLCSFGGSILPRPLDGRLRYVGGDTRIVMLPRDISYSDLLTRMRELFEGVDVIKYQQPDEDLDALVSVVSDDDVMNMMEEYDKLIAAGEGFTRLRIFLFSQHLDGDVASVAAHYNGDEWDTERRYVDALNNLGDVKTPTSPVSVEQLFGIGGSESGFPNNIGLRHLNVPRPSYSQRYGEMDSPWSPAYVSPGHYGVHDPREFPISPSSARFQIGAEDFDERIPDDFVRYSPKYRHYENHSPPHVDNLVWLPPGAVIQEKAGFPGNLSHPNSSFGGNHICEHCHSPFQKGQSPITDARLLDPHWQQVQPHFDQSSMANEYVGRPANSCVDCCRTGEHYMVHQDARLENGVFVKEQTDHPPTFYNELYNHDRGWRVHTNQSHQRYEDTRLHLPGNGRMVEPYVVDGNSVNSPFTQGKVYEMHSTSTSRSSHESTHCCHVSSEHNNDMYYNQQVGGGGSYVQPSGFEESTGQHLMYGADSFYQMQQNLPPIQSLRRNANSPVHAGSPYEAANLPIQNGGINSSFVRNIADVSPRIPGVAAYDRVQNPWPSPNVPYRIVGNDSPAAVENPSVLGPWSNPNTGHDVRPLFAPDLVQRQPGAQLMEIHPERAYNELMLPMQLDGKEAGSALLSTDQQSRMGTTTMQTLEGRENQNVTQNVSETKHCYAADNPTPLPPCVGVQHGAEVDLKQMEPTEHKTGITGVSEPESTALQKGGDVSEGRLSLLPELIASVKKAVLEDSEETVKAQSNASPAVLPACDNDEKNLEESMNGKTEADLDSDLHGSSEQQKVSKIESTTAEAEALAKGLQTIKNDDLEEIRELGSGTYGAVYHGKWRGSDVAIKRIKASCFAGRPSERARLIADFWKEALILSSLHHPNVVSFYGVVRDGPDGSLATVTEFMVNGSLKQFLKKKDRTIDRRKRLILAMDAAFGMEYLHGKNIVHFDLKCENLLVNMRDPHRPICKIGDLGLSKVKQHTLVSGGVRGTLPWMAPELLNGKSNMVSEKIDVYSFGIVMWELLTGEEPYSDMRCASIIGGIVNNTLRPQIPSWCDPEWKSLMESCWAGDPAERPSFSEISQTLRKMAAAMNVK